MPNFTLRASTLESENRPLGLAISSSMPAGASTIGSCGIVRTVRSFPACVVRETSVSAFSFRNRFTWEGVEFVHLRKIAMLVCTRWWRNDCSSHLS